MTQATLDGGFPPLMIEPIDFYSLYENRKKQEPVQKIQKKKILIK